MYVFMEAYQSESTEKKIGLLLSFIFIINSTYDLIKLQIVANTCIPFYMFARRKMSENCGINILILVTLIKLKNPHKILNPKYLQRNLLAKLYEWVWYIQRYWGISSIHDMIVLFNTNKNTDKKGFSSIS